MSELTQKRPRGAHSQELVRRVRVEGSAQSKPPSTMYGLGFGPSASRPDDLPQHVGDRVQLTGGLRREESCGA